MAKFWFVSAPLFGHLDWGGYLKTAQALSKQGHEVIWVSQPKIGGYLLQQGITFAPIEETGWLWPPPPPPDLTTISPQEAIFVRYRRALDTWLDEHLVPMGVESLLALADQTGPPDVLVTDPFLSASAVVAEKLGIKMAVCGWPATAELDESKLFAVQRELARISRDRIGHFCQRFGVKGINFTQGPTPAVQSPHLHLSYFNEYWHQGEPDFLPQTHFVGGSISTPHTAPPQWLTALPDQPVILITLGSVFTGDLGFFAWSAQAAHRLGFIPIVVIGNNPISPEDKVQLKHALPPTTRLLNWVDFDHVMPRLTSIVHHGGMGTTHAALLHGLPQVVVPHAADQRGQAKRVSNAKVGLNLSAHDVKNGQLLPAIKAVSTEAKVKQQAVWLADELEKLGGPQRAAEHLITLI
ncbi:MAG: glycosyltransferase family 1 protein [Anaerolineales bacterium]|nr:glycosyltransferase family 1 protein [Anaerolineales bacterium]